MASEHVLRLPRSDDPSSAVILNITSDGPSPLDIQILATEGEAPYITTIRHSTVSKLRDKRSPLSGSQWEDLLLSTFLQRHANGQDTANGTTKVEIIASLAGDTLAIIFRNNISGITQKLGEVILKQNPDLELDILNWAAVAVERGDALKMEVQDLTKRYEEQKDTIQKLNKQLEDLIEAKKAHEDLLLQRFSALLNVKKRKIRDQQRLLASVKPDPAIVVKVQATRDGTKGRTPAASRAGKRKAKGAAVTETEDESEDDGFEKRVPLSKQESDGSEKMNTPEHSEGTITQDDSDDDPVPKPKEQVSPDQVKDDEKDGGKGGKTEIYIPPTRKLPFDKVDDAGDISGGKRNVAESQSTLNQEAGNNEDETTDEDDDDEL